MRGLDPLENSVWIRLEEYTVGQVINLDNFSAGTKNRVTGTSIGKGFAGNQKRHNFSRGPNDPWFKEPQITR